jgi:predicted nucleotidyltransferase
VEKLTLTTSILGTLAYSSLFHHPLTLDELSQRLIGVSHVDKKNVLQTLQKISQVIEQSHRFTVKGSEGDFQIRKKQEYLSRLKQSEVQSLVQLLRKFPSISSVYITGSLAMQNIQSINDDIDILIVTKPNQLWLVRLLVVITTRLLGKYRLHGTKGEYGWCFNLWLDQKHLVLPKEQRSVYTAYEIIQSVQVLGTQNELLSENEWVNEYINYSDIFDQRKNYEARTKDQENVRDVLTFLDWVSWQLQWVYMKPKKTIERVGRGFAFFHPRNTKRIIVEKWQQRLEEIGVPQKEREQLQLAFDHYET